MRWRRPAAIVLLALLAPAGSAEWSAYGSVEPDTVYDTAPYMWPDPSAFERRLYFNVVTLTMASEGGKPALTPNVGALGTRFDLGASEHHVAIFGEWVDCNGDGYVGMAETAVREYDARLLVDTSRCPPTRGSHAHWVVGAHNYNLVVSELIPIARWRPSSDARVHVDTEARVWGDLGRPDAPPPSASCATHPAPRGTYATVGGLLDHLDCRADVLGTWNRAMDAMGDPAGLRFADPDDGSSGRLSGTYLLGDEHSDHAIVYASDCGGPPVADAGLVAIPSPSPGVGDPTRPSVAATANLTIEAFLDDCDTSNDRGADVYRYVEGHVSNVDPNDKREADWNFRHTNASRGALPLSMVPGGYSGNAGVASDGGVGVGGTRWTAAAATEKLGPNTVRADLARGDVAFAPAHWMSFYAHVGSATRAAALRLPGATDVYGAWQCGERTSGIRHGWNCDPERWNRNADGSPYPDPFRDLARVGDPFELRDVDCYDGRIGETGLGVQPAFYGESPCAWHVP